MEGLIFDVRQALRALRRSPGFGAAAVAILAIGIAANTAVFSVADAGLFRPLNYDRPRVPRRGGASGRSARGDPHRPDLAPAVSRRSRNREPEHHAKWDAPRSGRRAPGLVSFSEAERPFRDRVGIADRAGDLPAVD